MSHRWDGAPVKVSEASVGHVWIVIVCFLNLFGGWSSLFLPQARRSCSVCDLTAQCQPSDRCLQWMCFHLDVVLIQIRWVPTSTAVSWQDVSTVSFGTWISWVFLFYATWYFHSTWFQREISYFPLHWIYLNSLKHVPALFRFPLTLGRTLTPMMHDLQSELLLYLSLCKLCICPG